MKLKIKPNFPLHFMILPGFILVLIYSYGPMIGILIAFEKYIPTKGILHSKWVGFDNYVYMWNQPGIGRVFVNTVYIATMKIIVGLIVPLFIALSLNEIGKKYFKRSIQTLIYLPYFLSWVILSGILLDILSPSTGIINSIIQWFGFEPIYFLGSNNWFPYVLVISNEWKEFGFSTIVYLAAITSINPSLYEAGVIDGANRIKQTWHITLPGMRPIIILLATLSLANVLNAGFEQVFVLYNTQVLQSGDIIDTVVYRMGIENAQFGPATAIGLLKSVVSTLFISIAYYLAYRLADYRIF